MTEQDASDADESLDRETDAGDGEAPAGDGDEFPFEDVEESASVEEEFDDAPSDVEGGPEEFDVEVDEEFIDQVENEGPEAAAEQISVLQARVSDLEKKLADRQTELEDVTSKLKRKQADFENYKKRMKKRREQEKQRATENLVENLLEVRDNLDRALEHEDAEIRDGIESTLHQFDRVLDDENVDLIEPKPGEDVDPQRHEVLMRVESDQPEDAIADVHRPGYVMADKVLRPAQVTVSKSAEE
jgi:molecular chaperone GrpE